MTFVIFTCVVLLVAGGMAAAYVTMDDYEGHWVSVGVMEGDRFVPFPGQAVCHEIIIKDDKAMYLINQDPMNVVYGRHRLKVDLTAQLRMEYRMSMEEGRLILTDISGMQMVFEKVEEGETNE